MSSLFEHVHKQRKERIAQCNKNFKVRDNMKRTFERILFMVIGAFIAFFAYVVGNADRDADAQEVPDRGALTCHTLFAKRIVVGDPTTGGIVIGTYDKEKHGEDGVSIVIAYGDLTRTSKKEDIQNYIRLIVSNDKAAILLKDSKGHKILNPD